MLRAERHIITKKHKLFSTIDEYSFKSKNLYNQANFRIRQEFISNGKWLRYYDLDKILQSEECYKELTSKISQQVLKLLDKNWKSFFKAIKDWKKNPDKYLGRPKLPKYKDVKKGRNIIVFGNQSCIKKDNYIQFPKIFNKHRLLSKLDGKLKEVRIIPTSNNVYIIEVVKELLDVKLLENNNRYCSIDIGLNNLAAITTNINKVPILVNGKGLKYINQYCNKKVSYYKSILEKMNHNKTSNRIKKLNLKRNNKINDYLHKTSRFIVNYCTDNNINTIIIGKNDNWKQNINIGRVNNQNFVQIPFCKLIQMIQYKAEESGINVILVEESYTSGTSFLDNELPIKENYNKKRRIKRGLFKSNTGKLINSDVNGSLQIMKKVVDDVTNLMYTNSLNNQSIEGLVVNPIKVNF